MSTAQTFEVDMISSCSSLWDVIRGTRHIGSASLSFLVNACWQESVSSSIKKYFASANSSKISRYVSGSATVPSRR